MTIFQKIAIFLSCKDWRPTSKGTMERLHARHNIHYTVSCIQLLLCGPASTVTPQSRWQCTYGTQRLLNRHAVFVRLLFVI